MTILPFLAIYQNEVRLSAKRIGPYFMILLCAGNGLLWWGWGPAVGRGIAINSDFSIAGVLPIYSFLTLPLFTAVFMANPVMNDFRYGVDSLIFSKPITRLQYLLGKFLGNFFVLACCQSAFVVAWFVLQAVPKAGVTTIPGMRVVPYIKHFLVLVVISHLGLAAFYFVIGVLTRSAKIVYGLGVSFYPLIMMYHIAFLKSLSPRWRFIFDPLVMDRNNIHSVKKADVSITNYMAVVYDNDLIANRIGMLLITALLLAFLYYRFKTTEQSSSLPAEDFTSLNLSTKSDEQFYETSTFILPAFHKEVFTAVPLPVVSIAKESFANNIRKLGAALAVEFRLLLFERSILVVMSLAVFLSIFEIAFWPARGGPAFSAYYAVNTAGLMLLFLVGIPVFYVGEALNRDGDFRMEGLLWSHPLPSYVILSAKLLATLLLLFGLIISVGVIAVVIQFVKGDTPLELSAYFNVYSLILIPNAIFLAATALALHVLLGNRYVAYVAAIGICVGLLYFYSQGHTDALHNPLLYKLWSYSDLTAPNLFRILKLRGYTLGLAAVFIIVAHLVNAWRTLRLRS